MGRIYRNGELYTADANTFSVELTWAEYQALNRTEKMNGTFYYITDIDPFVDVATYGFTPIGTIISVMGNHAPNNYLVCDGTVYNIADYPELANYFFIEFGASNKFGGNGTTTFAVPDLQGEFLRGTGTNSHTASTGMVQGSGADVGVHQDSTEIPSVWANETNLNTAQVSANFYDGARGVSKYKPNSSSSITASGFYAVGIRPTNTSVLYCIASKNIYLKPENQYSTDETVVGTWTDGRPIYQKTLTVAFPSSITDGTDASKQNPHGISNFDKCVSLQPSFYNRSWNNYHSYLYVVPQGTSIETLSNRSNMANLQVDVTIQYLKTTD